VRPVRRNVCEREALDRLRDVVARLKGAGNVAASGDVFIEAIFCAGFEIEGEGAHGWVHCQGEEEGEESESEAHGVGMC
jgi:hypothetical protein